MSKRGVLALSIVAILLVFGFAGYYMYGQQEITSEASTNMSEVDRHCPNKRGVQVTVVNENSKAKVGGATVYASTPDCNRDDTADADTKVEYTPATCTTASSGTDLGKCTIEARIGNSNFVRYYFRARKDISATQAFKAPFPTFWNGYQKTEMMPIYNAAGTLYQTLEGHNGAK